MKKCKKLKLKPRFYWIFSLVVAGIGIVQGASGGLLLTTAIDSVGMELARDAYAMNSAINVFIAGLGTQMYGVIGDVLNSQSNFNSTVSSNITTNQPEIPNEISLRQDYIFNLAAAFIEKFK